MQIVRANTEILTPISEGGIKELQFIELVGRTCYKSTDKITEDGESAKKFVANLIKNGHEAMIEHGSITVKFIVDRGVSHELVRHRIASFAQESTRYCNYTKNKFGRECTFIRPYMFDVECGRSQDYSNWCRAMEAAEESYFALIDAGCSPQEARSVLPNSLKTEVIMTANYREWRAFMKLRAVGVTGAPHPQMREVAIPLLRKFKEAIPVLFDDLEV